MIKILFVALFFTTSAFAKSQLESIVNNINWDEVSLPFVPAVQVQNKYFKVTFFDDFKGKPDNSAESNFCFDTLKPQCTIWSGFESNTFPCDHSNLPLSNPGSNPPMKANLKSALYSLFPDANYEPLSLSSIKTAYAQTLSTRWKDVNKCNWASYSNVNWMATDYDNHFSAKMDASQVTVDPSGKGYLILSARKGKILEECIFGGTVGPQMGIKGKSCLLYNVQHSVTGPLNIYWVDPNPKWPGIYYRKINGGCPYGGTEGVNCQVRAFAPGELSPLVTYNLMNYKGNISLYYFNDKKFACADNIQYPNDGVVFNKISCPIFNGGILSQKTKDSSNHVNGFTQKGGVFEVKLKIPKGRGAFPAAWLMPTHGGWPYKGGEIDIMEARDNADEVYQTFHQGKCIDSVTKTEIIYDPNDPNDPNKLIDNGNCQKIANAVSINYYKGHDSVEIKKNEFHTRDHVYSVEWSDSKIQWYLNNRPTNMVAPGVAPSGATINNKMEGFMVNGDIPSNLFVFDSHNMPHEPFYWILNHSTWVSAENLPTWAEQHLYIDYVKVYSECKTQNDFCPQGGVFEEGVGCVIRSRNGSPLQTFPSACVSRFKSRTCPAGGEIVGADCQVHAFEKPKVVPGVNYWVDANPAFPGAYYAKINGACPYGGIAGVNCQLETLSPVLAAPQNKTVVPGVQYWVDADPRWPGIYYHKINGSCPVGGSGSANCQLKSYAANLVRPGVSYWVDTDPRWPGVYYSKIGGACPFGGNVGVNCQLEILALPTFYLNPTVQYWVETNSNFPGIYYAKISGACPYGGSGSVNCLVKAFPKPSIMPNINYWVDANPNYPGVYYAKINGSCPHGGSVGVNCQLIAFPNGKVEPGVNYWIEKNPLNPGVYYTPDFR